MKDHRFLPVGFAKALLSALLGAMFFISAVQAQTVTTELELSAEIDAANVSGGDVTITLGDDISLSGTLPDIDKESGTLTIEGGSHTLSRSSEAVTLQFSMLTITQGTVVIEDLTISGGSAEYGGGICADGGATVTLTNSTVSGNTAGMYGGGIYADNATVTLTNSTVSDNTASLGGGIFAKSNANVTLANSTVSGNTAVWGGGIFAYDSVTVTLTNSTVSGNTAGFSGGGICADMDATVTLLRSTVSGNAAPENGGGIFAHNATVTLTNSTVLDNTAEGEGGGIYADGSSVTLTNSTVSGNTSEWEGGGIYADVGAVVTLTNSTVSGNAAPENGGGIFAEGESSVTLANSTVSDNTAGYYGGGIFANSTNGIALTRSIIAGNSASNGAETYLYDGSTIPADANNVFGHNGLTNAQAFYNFTPGPSDVNCTLDGTNTPLSQILNPILANNGGPTQTHALVAGSPAIDLASAGPATDQRGISRPQGAGVDAGAYEFVSADPDPDPILDYNYSRSLVSNTAKLNAWVLDPEGRLGVGANWIMEGDLSRGFRYVDGMLVGMFDTTGVHRFRVSGTDGTITVNHSFTVRVMAPTVCPTIFGAWINGDYLSIEVLEEASHGIAAQTAPLTLTLERGQAVEIRFDWDYIKDGFGFCIIDGTLPTGLVLDGRSGVISGVPTASGSYRFLVSVKDWRGRGYQWVDLSIP